MMFTACSTTTLCTEAPPVPCLLYKLSTIVTLDILPVRPTSSERGQSQPSVKRGRTVRCSRQGMEQSLPLLHLRRQGPECSFLFCAALAVFISQIKYARERVVGAVHNFSCLPMHASNIAFIYSRYMKNCIVYETSHMHDLIIKQVCHSWHQWHVHCTTAACLGHLRAVLDRELLYGAFVQLYWLLAEDKEYINVSTVILKVSACFCTGCSKATCGFLIMCKHEH